MKISIKQDADSADLTIACRLVDSNYPQVQLQPGEWVEVGDCVPGTHALRVGVILPAGSAWATLSLSGATFNGETSIKDLFMGPTDGGRYELEVAP